MEEIIELFESLDFESNSYFYHITSKGFGDEIIENGLYLRINNLFSTAIELPEEMISDPVSYCKGEYSDGILKRQEMVIIGCEKGTEDSLVQIDDEIWIGATKYEYVIPSEHVVGYIDLKNLNVIYNENYMYGGRHV